jgi:transcriptional regulator with XRE-family HTH domain
MVSKRSLALKRNDANKEAFNQIVGKNVRAIRQMRNITIEELDYKSGVDYTTIHAIELGKRGSSSYTLARLAKALGLKNPAPFFDGAMELLSVNEDEEE